MAEVGGSSPIDEYNRSAPPPAQSPGADASKPIATVLVTFGAGHATFRSQARRLAKEAEQTGWFADVLCLTDLSRDPIVLDLLDRHGEFIRRNRRGFGYWLWKPFLLSRLLRRYPPDTLIMYADAGCELSPLGKDRLAAYLRLASEQGTLFFTIPFPEWKWTRPDLLAKPEFDIVNPNSPQVQATWFILATNQRNMKLIDDWLTLASAEEGRFLVDCGRPAEPTGFMEHRHDQSILSLLVKQGGLPVQPWEDRFARDLYVINSWVLLFPVHARRSRRRRVVKGLAALSSHSRCMRNLSRPSIAFRAVTGARRQIDPILQKSKGFIRWLVSPLA